MISVMAETNNGEFISGLKLEQLDNKDIKWYWADFDCPGEDEIKLLETHFKFHQLAIEDCVNFLQRPKVDFYEGYSFFVLHAISEELKVVEVNLFVGEKYVVSFHLKDLPEIKAAREELLRRKSNAWNKGNIFAAYLLMDNIVDKYFPLVFKIEDQLEEIENTAASHLSRNLIETLYDVRRDLLKLRHSVNSMRDLLYRLLNSTHLIEFESNMRYFRDIYDHLLKLCDMIESNRDVTSDMRDSYLSINSNRMNVIMTLLTVITAIFIPLTFIVGVYGMNFLYMPELKWRYGYFIVLGIMFFIGMFMFYWFKKKGWFDFPGWKE